MTRHLLHCAIVVCLGMLLAGGSAWAHDSGFGLARYGPDGALDRTFGTDGVVVARSTQRGFVANALALQADGKILIAGMDSDVATGSLLLAVARYNVDGTPDSAFGTRGTVTTAVGAAGAQATAVAVQPDGRILVGGTAFAYGAAQDRFVIARYGSDGVIDTSFGTDGLTTTHVGVGPAALQALALQPDGRILVAGTAFSNGPTDDDFALVRYLQNGALDPSFGTGGTVTTDFSSGEAGLSSSGSLDRLGGMVLQPDGKIVLAGFTRGDQQAFALARYYPNGSLDISFGVDGRTRLAAVEPQVFAVELQSGGDLVIAGSAGASSRATAPFALIRFHADGSPDQSFGVGGLATTSVDGSRSGARAVVVQPDSKLLAAGARFGAPSAQGDALPQSGFALARYNPDGSIDIAFGSGRDGRALTDMGDAGATPLALVMQPDGKIIAAGLVFFRVPATPPSGAFAVLRHLAGPAAGLALLGVTLALRLVLRPGSRPRPRGQAA